jgi:hypothetical protein
MLAQCCGRQRAWRGSRRIRTTISVGGTIADVPANLMLKVSNPAMKLR